MKLTRLYTFQNKVYVESGYRVFYTTRAGYLMTDIPKFCANGMKMAHLYQINQRSRHDYEMIVPSADAERYLGIFLKKMDRRFYKMIVMEDGRICKYMAIVYTQKISHPIVELLEEWRKKNAIRNPNGWRPPKLSQLSQRIRH